MNNSHKLFLAKGTVYLYVSSCYCWNLGIHSLGSPENGLDICVNASQRYIHIYIQQYRLSIIKTHDYAIAHHILNVFIFKPDIQYFNAKLYMAVHYKPTSRIIPSTRESGFGWNEWQNQFSFDEQRCFYLEIVSNNSSCAGSRGISRWPLWIPLSGQQNAM